MRYHRHNHSLPRHSQQPSDGHRGVVRLRRLRADDISPLQHLLLLSGVDRRHLRTMAASTDLMGVAAGSVVACAGYRATELIGVLDGRVDAVDAAGRTLRLSGGHHVDGVSVFDRAPRTWTLTARTDATLLVIQPRAIDLAVLDIPGFEWRLRTAEERREGWADRPLPTVPTRLGEPQLQLR